MPNQETKMLASRYDKRKVKELKPYRSITREEAERLQYGQHIHVIDRAGTVANAKVNGKVKTWKRNPERIEIPCKFGLYEYFTITQHDLADIVIPIEDNRYCGKCGCHWITHNDDGSCVKD